VTSAAHFTASFSVISRTPVPGKGKIGVAIGMVIRKRMRFEFEPEGFELRKKAAGVADAGNCVELPALEEIGVAVALSAAYGNKALANKPHIELWQVPRRILNASFRGTVPDHGVNARETPQGLTQGTGRQEATVACAATVKHHHLGRALQAIVLHSVVGDDHITVRVSSQQRLSCGNAIAPDKDRHATAPGQQKGFIADQRRQGGCRH
jgi:hypothetical protein